MHACTLLAVSCCCLHLLTLFLCGSVAFSGLGKTLQTICFLAWLREHRGISGPHFVAVPLNVLDTWVAEVARWCPTMRVVRFHGSEKERDRIIKEKLKFGEWDLLVTTYETVVVAQRVFQHHFFFAYGQRTSQLVRGNSFSWLVLMPRSLSRRFQ